jgi:hypothetical protein
MKLMRSPIAVGVLVLIALLLVGNSLKNSRSVQNMWNRTFTKQTAKPAAKPAVQPAAKPAAKPASAAKASTTRTTAARGSNNIPDPDIATLTEAVVRVPVDAALVSADAERWTAAPRRDPFWRRSSALERRGPKAADVLTLKGIWRQTDSTLAIINNRIVSEGEIIQGFSIVTIEMGRVWVEGPDGRESIEFKVPSAPAAVRAGDQDGEPEGAQPAQDKEDQDDRDLDDPEPGPQLAVT